MSSPGLECFSAMARVALFVLKNWQKSHIVGLNLRAQKSIINHDDHGDGESLVKVNCFFSRSCKNRNLDQPSD